MQNHSVPVRRAQQNQITKLFTSFYVKKFSYLKQAIKNATVNSDLKHSQLNLRCFKILDIRWHKTREEPTFENSKKIKDNQAKIYKFTRTILEMYD